MRTLFIGNSHTYFNDMPKIFKDICEENGIDMQVTMLTKGGMGFDYHVDYEIWGDFWTCNNGPIKGNWQITFPIVDKE